MPESRHIIVGSEQRSAATLSPLIYGEFIEPLNDLLPGMWAEKVQDRSFEGVLQPQQVYPPGQNWVYPRWRPLAAAVPRFDHWPERPGELEMVDAHATVDLDPLNAFVGAHSARVTVTAAAGTSFVAGIAQDGVAVKQGQALDVGMYLRSNVTPGSSVSVMLGRNYGAFFRAYAVMTCEVITTEWARYTGVLTPDTTDDGATLAIVASQPGTFWVDKVSLMPQDNRRGWRPDVVEAIRALKPGIIRFGGSSLIYYDWRIGVGPRERRAPFVNQPWGNREENDVGLQEFLEFCELVGAQPLICLNSNSATVEQILEEIEYCNGPVASRWGSARAAMGHPAPFNVQYWQIGNEQAGEEYEQRMVDTARAIRNRYPQLTLMASYPSDNILFNLSDEIDYVCPHIYTPYAGDVERELVALERKIHDHARNKALKIAVTEWNHTGGHWGWARAWLLTLFNALNAARMFNLYQRHGEIIRIANRSNMTNSCNSGVLQTSPSDMYFTPTYYVQQAYANFAGDRALVVATASDEVLDIAATRRGSEADGEIALFVVNYTGNAEARAIEWPTTDRSSMTCQAWSLAGTGLDAVNSFVEKDHVAPREATLAMRDGIIEYQFPPYSVTVLHGVL